MGRAPAALTGPSEHSGWRGGGEKKSVTHHHAHTQTKTHTTASPINQPLAAQKHLSDHVQHFTQYVNTQLARCVFICLARGFLEKAEVLPTSL